MSSAGPSTDRTGSSRREELDISLGKPLVTRKVQASSSAEESGGDSSAELDAAGSTKDSETSREPELNAADSDDGPPDLPEGTVVVEPQPVAESKLIFRGPEFPSKRRSNQKTFGNSIASKVTCTSCGKQLNPSKKGAIKRHPKLKVIVCKKCYKYYSSGEISQDADGLDEQCRWCGEGGRLLGCDFCHNAFCKGCILRNLGRSELRIITDAGSEKWKCYVCDPPKLKGLVSHCNEVFNQLEEERNRGDLMQIKQAKSQRKPSAPGKKFDAVSIIPICDESMNVTPKTLGIVIEKLLAATTSMTFMLNTLQTDIKEGGYGSDQAAIAEGHSPAELGVIQLKKGLVKYFLALKETLFTSEVKEEKSQNDNLNKKSSTKACGSSVASESKKFKNSSKGKSNNSERKYTKSRISTSDSDDADLKSRKAEQNKGLEKPKHKDSSASDKVKVGTNEVIFMSDDDDDDEDDDDEVEFLGESKLTDDMFVDGDKINSPIKNEWSPKEKDTIKDECASSHSDSSEESHKVSHLKEQSACNNQVSDNETQSHQRERSRDSEKVKRTSSNEEEGISKKKDREEKNSRKKDERTPRKRSLSDKLEKTPKKRDEKTTPVKNEDKSIPQQDQEDKKCLVKAEHDSSNDDSDLSVDDIPLIMRSQKTEKKLNEDRKKKPVKEKPEGDQKCSSSENSSKKDLVKENEKSSSEETLNSNTKEEVHSPITNHTNSFLSNKPLHDPENAAAQLSLLMEMANEISKNQGNDSDNSADNHLDHDADDMDDDFNQFTNHITDKLCDNTDVFDMNEKERSETPKLINSDGDHENSHPTPKTENLDISDNVNSDNVNSDNVNSDNVNSDNVNSDNVNSDNVNSDNVNSDNVNSDNDNSDNDNSDNDSAKASKHSDNESSTKLTPNKRRFRNSKIRPRPQSSVSDSENEPCDGGADKRKRASSKNKSLSSDGRKKNNDPSDSNNNQSDGGNHSDHGDQSNSNQSNDGKKDDNTDSDKDKDKSNDNDSENEKKTKAKKKETKKQEDGKKSKDSKKITTKNESNHDDSDKESKVKKENKGKTNSSDASDNNGNNSDSDSDSSDSSDDSDLYTRKRRRTRMGKNKKEESTQKETEKKMPLGKKEVDSKRETRSRKPKKEKTESSNEEDAEKEEVASEKTKVKKEDNSESSNYDSELEKEIKKLSQKVVIKKSTKQKKKEKSDTESKENDKKKGKDKDNKNTDEMSFSDSSHESADSSDDEEDDKSSKEDEAKIKEEKENAEKLASMIEDADKEAEEEEEEEDEEDESSDSDSSGSDIITNKKRKRADKNSTKKSGEDSTSDAQPKKKKSNRLLQAKLSDSDSDEKGKKKNKSDVSSDDSLSDASSSSSDSDSSSDTSKKKKKKKGKGKKGKKSKKDSDDSDDSDESKKKGKKGKRRKRIKAPKNSSDSGSYSDSDSDKNSPGGPSKRKKIRKLISDKKLTDTTKAAAKAEEERRKRVAERQKKFNRVFVDEAAVTPAECPVTKKLVLAFDKEEKPLLEVDKNLVIKLKPHQVEGVQFMFDCCVETLSQLKREEGGGCILAHCMGLGKTLSLITFVHTLLVNSKRTKLKSCLVVCPLNTVLNWKDEWEKWDSNEDISVYEMTNVKNNWHRADTLKSWVEDGGIMIIGYEMYRNLSQGHHVKNKKQRKIFEECLVNPGPDLVVCDEGHILKNDSSGVSKAMNKIHTKRRIVLTGTPLQNNLIEYHCMVSFVKPNLLGTRKEFCNRFVNPITNGQCSDSTSADVKIMKRRAHILHDLLDGCVQRKDYNVLTDFLPPKLEYVILVRLSEVQLELYQRYLDQYSHIAASNTEKRQSVGLFADYQNLMKIWSHPWVLKLDEIRQESKKRYDSDMDSFIDDESEESFSESSSNSSALVELSDDDDAQATTVSKPSTSTRATRASRRRGSDDEKMEVVKEWKTRSRGGGGGDDEPVVEVEKEKEPLSTEWWSEYLQDSDSHNLEISGKLKLAFEILRMCEDIGDKVLIFSQSLLSLDLLEDFLEYIDSGAAEEEKKKENEKKENEKKENENKENENKEKEKEKDTDKDKDKEKEKDKDKEKDKEKDKDKDKEKDKDKSKEKKKGKDKDKKEVNDFGNSWTKGADYFRLDGSTPAHYRKKWAESFNDPENYRSRLFLISTKAGSLGINLVSANRVIIFDASWNPSHDIQSIFRVYRFGQNKPVYVYRLVAQGTMEEKIYDRQVTKQSLSQRVIDEHQIERHFTQADLQELYVFKPEKLDDPNAPERPTPILPKDRMLAEMLQEQKHWIVAYHEHDSLLEDQQQEKLSEEERKAAWEEFENEKKGIVRRGPMPMQYMPGMNYAMNQPYMNQQMNMNMMQNMYLMQQQMQNNPVISLRSPDIHNIVQRVRALYPNLPPDQFQLKVHEVMRAQINQQIDMQQRQVQEQLKREMARSQQMKAQIARQFDHLQSQQQRMVGPPMAHGAANMMGPQGGSLANPGRPMPNSAATSQQLMGLLQHGGMPGTQ